jgi:hypothetical protein
MQLKLIAVSLTAISLFAQSPALPKVTTVMATLTVKDGPARADRTKVMPDEVRQTVVLYLDGKIQQWYARGDGKGVVFFLNCQTVDEAKAILEKLPLIQGGFASFEYMPLGPLSPLRLLIATPAK